MTSLECNSKLIKLEKLRLPYIMKLYTVVQNRKKNIIAQLFPQLKKLHSYLLAKL